MALERSIPVTENLSPPPVGGGYCGTCEMGTLYGTGGYHVRPYNLNTTGRKVRSAPRGTVET